MFAVIKTGGKQYLVKEKEKLRVEKIKSKQGEEIKFTDVLLAGEGDKVKIGQSRIKAQVSARVLKHGKEKKVWGIKYKAKKRERKKFGHRQPFSEIEIIKIKV